MRPGVPQTKSGNLVISVGWLDPVGCWDQHIVKLLTTNRLWPTGLEFAHTEGYPDSDGCCLVIPGRYHADDERIADIDNAIARYDWVLGFRVSDEEDLFDIHQIAGPERTRWWVQTPRVDREYGDARLFGVGFPPHFDELPADPPEKTTNAYLAAQNTHRRRQAAFNALAHIPNSTSLPTVGFTQGVEPRHYTEGMLAAKVAPCPAGPASPDSFRVYEALQAHCVPIADDITPGYDSAGYWRMLFPDCPFPILTDYNNLAGWVKDQLHQWPENANRVAAWWMRQKRRYTQWLREDLQALGAC